MKEASKYEPSLETNVAPHVVDAQVAIGAAGVLFKIFQAAEMALASKVEKVVNLELTGEGLARAAAEGGLEGEIDQVNPGNASTEELPRS